MVSQFIDKNILLTIKIFSLPGFSDSISGHLLEIYGRSL